MIIEYNKNLHTCKYRLFRASFLRTCITFQERKPTRGLKDPRSRSRRTSLTPPQELAELRLKSSIISSSVTCNHSKKNVDYSCIIVTHWSTEEMIEHQNWIHIVRWTNNIDIFIFNKYEIQTSDIKWLLGLRIDPEAQQRTLSARFDKKIVHSSLNTTGFFAASDCDSPSAVGGPTLCFSFSAQRYHNQFVF